VYENAIKHGAISVQTPTIFKTEHGEIQTAIIKCPQFELVHTLIHRKNPDLFLPECSPLEKPRSGGDLTEIDHVAIAVETNTLDTIVEWYRNALGFHIYTSRETKLTIETEHSGMNVVVVARDNIKFVLIEPLNRSKKSQIQEFLDYHSGPGVTHMAFYTDNAISTLKTLKQKEIGFIGVPHSYYEIWEGRDEYSMIAENWKEIEECELLVDGYIDEKDKEFKYLLQTFTVPLSDRPTLYFEIISRRKDDGFGRGNITQLYQAIEILQKERGNF
jgi:4-hydroxyphenylpyruvate dioxygenase